MGWKPKLFQQQHAHWYVFFIRRSPLLHVTLKHFKKPCSYTAVSGLESFLIFCYVSLFGKKKYMCDLCLDQRITISEEITLSLYIKRSTFFSLWIIWPRGSLFIVALIKSLFSILTQIIFLVVFQAGLKFCFGDMYTSGTEVCGLKFILIPKLGEVTVSTNSVSTWRRETCIRFHIDTTISNTEYYLTR